MGGKLLTKVFNLAEKRISREEYFKLRKQIILDFRRFYPDCRIVTPEVLRNKNTFGDIDVLTNLQHDQIKRIITDCYKIFKPHVNAGVFSFPIDGFQVDIIHVPNDYFNISYEFYSNGDAGNIIGRLFNSFGLSFGHRGLFYKLLRSYFSGKENDVNPLDKILITTDMEEILDFVGLDFQRWKDGFDNENDVFNFVESSPYFNARMFRFEELNNENKTRNRKRPMYCHFVERIEEKYKDQIIPRLSKQYWFPHVTKRWPHILEEIEKHRPRYERSYIIGKKWNGNLIKEIPLKDKELGEFIVGFKNSFEDFNDWVISTPQNKIRESLENYLWGWEAGKDAYYDS